MAKLAVFFLIFPLSMSVKTLLPAHNNLYGIVTMDKSSKTRGIHNACSIGVKRFKDSIEFLNHDFTPSTLALSQTILVPHLADWPQRFDDSFNLKIISHRNSLLLYISQISLLIASTQQVILPLDFQSLKFHSLQSQYPVQLLITSLALIFKLGIPIRTFCIEFELQNGESEKFQKLVELRLVKLIREVEKVFNVPPMVIKMGKSEFHPVKVVSMPLYKIINYLRKNYRSIDSQIAQSPTLLLYRRQLYQLELKMVEQFQGEIEILGLEDLADNLQNLVHKYQQQFMFEGLKIAPKYVNCQSLLQVVHQNFTNRLKSVADGMLAYAVLQGGYYPRHSILKSGLGKMIDFTGRIFPFWLIKLVRKLKLPLTVTFNYLSPDAFGVSNYFQSSYRKVTPDRINYYTTVDSI